MRITENLRIPTIGIGAGRYTSGQVQVFHDVIGLYDRLQPKFSKRYANTAQTIRDALALHREDIEGRVFPDSSHCFKIKQFEFDSFCNMVSQPSIESQHQCYEELEVDKAKMDMDMKAVGLY